MAIDKNNSRLATDARNFLIEMALRNAITRLRLTRNQVDLLDADTLESMLAEHIKANGTCTVPPALTDVI
jgi:hypothetical protein